MLIDSDTNGENSANETNESNKDNTSIISCLVKSKKYIKISLMLKQSVYDPYKNSFKYKTEMMRYVESYFFNDSVSIREEADITNDLLKFKDTIIKRSTEYIESKLNMVDLDRINDIKYHYSTMTQELFDILIYSKYGYYFNKKDIGFSIKLNCDINSNIFNDALTKASYTNFNKVRFNQIYNYDYRAYKPIDKIFNSLNHVLSCDICEEVISKRADFYSCRHLGDICKACYKLKVDLFKNRIKYLKDKIRQIGKSNLFNKEVAKTRAFLEGRVISSLEGGQKLQLIERSFKNIVNETPTNICRICFSKLDFRIEKNPIEKNKLLELNTGNTNISMGCLCGHMFHTECLNGLTDIACPYCRTDTKFSRLFL